MKYRLDKKHNFFSAFNKTTGFYYRSGLLDQNKKETDEDPFMASHPHLIDIGIMGHCVHGLNRLCEKAGIECYQDGPHVNLPNMSLDDYQNIIDQCESKVYQVALGGRGDPDQHEHFEDILKYSVGKNIIPNYTTSGLGMTKELAQTSKKYCGAVAVSWYRSDYTSKAIDLLLAAGVKTNIHYVVKKSTIKEAINLLENNGFPKVNAIIFLLHKPVGLGSYNQVLDYDAEDTKAFFRCIDENLNKYSIGFDSCTVPGLINMTSNIDQRSIESCEGGRFSCYISADSIMSPCSFDVKNKWALSLKELSIQDVWDSKLFDDFRSRLKHGTGNCSECKDLSLCLGGCPIERSVVLCDQK